MGAPEPPSNGKQPEPSGVEAPRDEVDPRSPRSSPAPIPVAPPVAPALLPADAPSRAPSRPPADAPPVAPAVPPAKASPLALPPADAPSVWPALPSANAPSPALPPADAPPVVPALPPADAPPVAAVLPPADAPPVVPAAVVTPRDPAAEELFQREKACYEQNGNSFRALNQLMWQVPLIAMSLTGGLWYGVANASLPSAARFGLLLLAALANLGLGALVLPRVRSVMEAHLEKMDEFHPPRNPQPKALDLFVLGTGGWFGARRGAMRVYSSLLLLTALLSSAGAVMVVAGSMTPTGQVSTTTTTITTANGTTTTTTVSSPPTAAPIDAAAMNSPPVDAAPLRSDSVWAPVDSSLPVSVDAMGQVMVDAPMSDASVTLDAWGPLPDALMSLDTSAGPTTP